MSDESYTPIPESSEPAHEPTVPPVPESPAGPNAGQEWSAVVAQMGALGDAIAAWARAAVNDPDAQRHLDEVRSGVNAIARKAEGAFNDVAASDFGQQVRQGAQQTGAAIGDTAQMVSEAAAPHVANAFAGLADVFGKAAQKVNETIAAQPVATQATPAPPSSADEDVVDVIDQPEKPAE